MFPIILAANAIPTHANPIWSARGKKVGFKSRRQNSGMPSPLLISTTTALVAIVVRCIVVFLKLLPSDPCFLVLLFLRLEATGATTLTHMSAQAVTMSAFGRDVAFRSGLVRKWQGCKVHFLKGSYAYVISVLRIRLVKET